jgi:hypothetical protein
VVTLPRLAVIVAAFVLGLPVCVVADTLFMRDGTRIRGELLAFRNGVIEFEERRGSGSGRTVRVNRDEVARIEFDDFGGGGGNVGGGGRPGGMRERQLMIAANTPWTDSGIELRGGQTIYVRRVGTSRGERTGATAQRASTIRRQTRAGRCPTDPRPR